MVESELLQEGAELEIDRGFTRNLAEGKPETCDAGKEGQVKAMLEWVMGKDSQDGRGLKLVTSGSKRKAPYLPLNLKSQN